MESNKKLKTNFIPYIVSFILIILFILLTRSLIFGQKTQEIILTLLFLHATFNQLLIFIKTKNRLFIPFLSLYFLTFLYNLLLLFKVESVTRETALLFIIPIGILVIIVIIILITRGINPMTRSFLEKAAQSIDEAANGFTTRPYPVGNIKTSKVEINNFARFCMNQLITVTYFVKEGVFLVLDTSEMKLTSILKINFQKQTYIYFDYSGQITVNIAKKDYKKFKEKLTFNQLCESLGALMKTFYELYQQDEKDKIIKILQESKADNRNSNPGESDEGKTHNQINVV